MLHKLRDELGLTAKAFEKGGGVGGTWYFNTYPGAKSDTEGFVYRYSFDKDLLQEWDWSTRYLDQPDVLAYLQHVVERYDLGRDIQLDTEVTGAVFDESTDLWTVSTADGGVAHLPLPRQRARAAGEDATCPTSRAGTRSRVGWCTPTPGRPTSTSPASASA